MSLEVFQVTVVELSSRQEDLVLGCLKKFHTDSRVPGIQPQLGLNPGGGPEDYPTAMTHRFCCVDILKSIVSY